MNGKKCDKENINYLLNEEKKSSVLAPSDGYPEEIPLTE
jgi:hypothetical protein